MIEQARPEDLEALVHLLAAQMVEHRIESTSESLAAVVRQVLADERHGFLLVGRAGDTVVGVAYVAIILSAEHGGLSGWLEELYVAPEQRGSGLGTALMEAVTRQARARGLVALDLEIDVEHQRVESLYRRFGFHRMTRSHWAKRLLE